MILAAAAVAAAAPAVSSAAPAAAANASSIRPPAIVGAIRWDAYFSQPGEKAFEDPNFGIVTRTTTFDMSPKDWHYRIPFFGTEVNDTAITANGNSPDVMAQELEYAQKTGIKFWAFCNYPIGCKDYHPAECKRIQCCADNVGLSYAWNLYQNHPDQHKVNFTLLLQPGYWFHGQESGSNETWAQELARYVGYFKKPNYQLVDVGGQAGRPLVFIFGHISNTTAGYLQELRAAVNAGIGVEPYVVSMNGKLFDGVDAVSACGSQPCVCLERIVCPDTTLRTPVPKYMCLKLLLACSRWCGQPESAQPQRAKWCVYQKRAALSPSGLDFVRQLSDISEIWH